MIELNDAEGALLSDIFRAGSMRWDVYNQRCALDGLDPCRLMLNLRMLEFSNLHFVGGEHEGRGSMTDRDVADDARVALTDRGKRVAEPVSRVREVFCDDAPLPNTPVLTSSSRRRRGGHLKLPPQRNMFPPVD